MRRTRIPILCAATLVAAAAAAPVGAQAGGLGSVVGAVASAPRALLGGLLGGGRARHSRHHARHAAHDRSHAAAEPPQKEAAHPPAEPPAVTAAIPAETQPAAASEAKATDREGAGFWPSAYDDAFGYVLTPAGFAGAFWTRGYADVVEGMFVPKPAEPAGKRRGRSAPESSQTAAFVAAPGCREAERSGVLIERVEHAVATTDAQRAALAELGSALRAAAERVRVACAADMSGGPSARLEAMWRHLRALRQAVTMVRAPLRTFYDSLDAEQKTKFDSATPRDGAPPAAAREAEPDAWLRACNESARMPQWPMARIAQAIQPTDEQRPLLELLIGTSLHFAHELRAACAAAPAPLTPIARLDAVDQQLTAMVYAVTVLRGTLNRFYGVLSEEQRARFDAMGSAGGRRAELR
jgi:LTXXQ motif family protein